jgi:hypothetical protein
MVGFSSLVRLPFIQQPGNTHAIFRSKGASK